LDKILFYTGIVSLLLALGDATPFRAIAYYYLPLMNMFRHPSIFRIFFIIPFLLIAGNAFESFIKAPKNIKQLLSLTIILSGITTSIIILSFIKNYSGTNLIDYFINYSFFKEHCTIYDHIILQGLL